MESEDKITLLQEVLLNIDWNQTDVDVTADLVKFTRCVVTDNRGKWYTDDTFIDMLMDEFPDDYVVWDYIILD